MSSLEKMSAGYKQSLAKSAYRYKRMCAGYDRTIAKQNARYMECLAQLEVARAAALSTPDSAKMLTQVRAERSELGREVRRIEGELRELKLELRYLRSCRRPLWFVIYAWLWRVCR